MFSQKKYANGLVVGTCAVASAALLWSIDGTFLRPELFSISPVLVVFLEHAVGFLVLAPLLLLHRRGIKKISKKTWVAIGYVALFGGALGTLFFTKALFLTGFRDISVVILLQKFQPVFALLLASLFLHERFPKGFYLYTALALGAGYFVTFKDFAALSGLFSTASLVALFSLLAAFAWGSSTVFGKYSLQGVHPGLLASLRFGTTALLMALPAFLFAGPSALGAVQTKEWGLFILIALTSGSGAMFLYYSGLKKIPASLATIAELAWPVSAIFFDFLAHGNILSFSQLLGAFVLVVSVARLTYLMRTRTIVGRVIKGIGKGKALGIATANLDVSCASDLPQGLYSATVTLPDRRSFPGLLYYGWNSLKGADTLEVHLQGFSGDLYGTELRVETERYLRLPKKFDSVEALVAQMKEDVNGATSDKDVA